MDFQPDTRVKDPWEDFIDLSYVSMSWLRHSPYCGCIRCDHKWKFKHVLEQLYKN
jgi:hypothetical protein